MSNMFNLEKVMEFTVLGDITPIVIEELGEYVERDVDFSTYLKGASGIDLPGWSPFLTYYGCFANSASKVIIQRLYDEGLIKLVSIRTWEGRIYVDDDVWGYCQGNKNG